MRLQIPILRRRLIGATRPVRAREGDGIRMALGPRMCHANEGSLGAIIYSCWPGTGSELAGHGRGVLGGRHGWKALALLRRWADTSAR